MLAAGGAAGAGAGAGAALTGAAEGAVSAGAGVPAAGAGGSEAGGAGCSAGLGVGVVGWAAARPNGKEATASVAKTIFCTLGICRRKAFQAGV